MDYMILALARNEKGQETQRGTYHQDKCRNDAAKQPEKSLKQALLVADESKEAFFKDERSTESNGKWPSEHAADSEPEHAL